MARLIAVAAFVVFIFSMPACSGSKNNPVSGDLTNEPAIRAERAIDSYECGRSLLGYWDVTVNPYTHEIDAEPIRSAQMHVNLRELLEEKFTPSCLTFGDNYFNLDGDFVISIGLKNPIGKKKFSGFDVRGIVIFNGTLFFPENQLKVPYHDNDEYTLVNPDGYTALWSPSAYPPGKYGKPVFEYSKGVYAYHPDTWDSATLNPFMNFYTLTNRHTFEAQGHKEVEFVIRFPEDPYTIPLHFGYAIDASWAKPANAGNPAVPDDFPPEANAGEAYKVDAEFNGVLTPLGGNLFGTLRIFDWQGTDTIEKVSIEAPDIFSGLVDAAWSQDKPNYTEYTLSFANTEGAVKGTYPLLVKAADNYSSPVIGKVSAYNLFQVEVRDFLEIEKTSEMLTCMPVEGSFDTSTATCFFYPLPSVNNVQVEGISSSLDPVDGFPKTLTTGLGGLCTSSREILVPTDYGAGSTEDITVYNMDTHKLKHTIDVPSDAGFNSSLPFDIACHENAQEAWVPLFNDGDIVSFMLNDSAPSLTRITISDQPTKVEVDQDLYKVFVFSDSDDTIAIIDGWMKSVDTTIDIKSDITSPDPLLPAFIGMQYIPQYGYLYITTLMQGKIEYYSIADGSYKGSIKVVDADTEMIIGLAFDPGSGYLYVTGQAFSGNGHIYAVDLTGKKVIASFETSGSNPSWPIIDSANKRIFVPDPGGHVDIFKINY